MLHNISKLSSGAVRSKFNILYDFHELEGLHPVRQGFIQFIDEVIWNSKESSLACLPEFIMILWFRLPCFLFHPTPDMLNDVHVWWLGWPILEHLDFLHLEELWCRDGSMRWSTILLLNLAPFMVGNVAFHPADLSHTPILDVTPDHDFSATKLDCFLGESRIHAGSSRSPAIFAATVM